MSGAMVLAPARICCSKQRPILIGKGTKILDYLVLVSTLGGLATFGANSFVIGPVVAAMFPALRAAFSASR
jgi:predicted PurR-regulated permease PerM